MQPRRPRLKAAAAAALLLLVLGSRAGPGGPPWPPAVALAPSELRGAWVQERSLRDRERIDRILARAEEGGFNAIFVCVFSEGRTLFPSAFAATSERLPPGFNPLAYLVPEAHRRGIAVHAWFVAGLVGAGEESPILAEHPEWALVGPDGKTTGWLNFSRPDVRQFMSDLMLEVVVRHGVDGVHFDYTRYPGAEWGFDPYSIEAFAREEQLDLNQLRYAELPAYGSFAGNPLVDPDTAEVLASFANGLPAITLNRYGAGEVLLLNWSAGERTVAVGSAVLSRGIARLLDAGGGLYLLRSATNARRYGDDDVVAALAWLEELGWAPREVAEGRIGDLDAASVVVLPNVYLFTPETAAQLAAFVQRGGGAIFIDGPTRSIGLSELQALTGMRARGRHFEQTMLLTGAGAHPLVPTSGRSADLAHYQELDERWKTFRKGGIDALIAEVYRRVKAHDSAVVVSVTVTSDQRQAADVALQDWAAWLAGDTVDLLIPRGYVDESQGLVPVLADWHTALQNDERVTMGLKVFTADGKAAVAKAPRQVLEELWLAHEAGSNGIMLFDLDRVSDQQLRALARGPFSAPAPGHEERR